MELTAEQTAIADKYGAKMFAEELASYPPARVEKLEHDEPGAVERYRETVLGRWRASAVAFLSPVECYRHALKGGFDPNNSTWRAMFQELTGLKLPRTIAGTMEAVRTYCGESAVNAVDQEREAYQQQKQEEQERKAAEVERAAAERQERIFQDYRQTVLAGEPLHGESLLDLARRLQIAVHPRTAGTLRRRIMWAQANRAKITGKGHCPQSVFDLYRECQQRLAEPVTA